MGWSESKLHSWLLGRAPAPGLVGSRGHDAAVLNTLAGRPVLCVDQTIEGVHFSADASPQQVGHKAAARALSDLAATAAKPKALLLSLHAPKSTDEAWLRDVIDAVDASGRRFGAPLVGGDLAAAPAACQLSVSALGCLPGEAQPPGRDRAAPGELLLVSGSLGGSSLGRHLAIEPRVELGAWLFAAGARAMLDVSDGLARDLERMARASKVRIDLEHVCVHPDAQRLAASSGRSAREHALHDGEDHELLVALAPECWERVRVPAAERFPGLQVIGRVRRGQGLWLVPEAGGEPQLWDGVGGWEHGS